MKVEIKKMTLKELIQAWSFDWGMKYPCPYIWFGWWLITFDPDSLDTFWSYIKTIEISFLPD